MPTSIHHRCLASYFLVNLPNGEFEIIDDEIVLRRAEELATRALQTTRRGIPFYSPFSVTISDDGRPAMCVWLDAGTALKTAKSLYDNWPESYAAQVNRHVCGIQDREYDSSVCGRLHDHIAETDADGIGQWRGPGSIHLDEDPDDEYPVEASDLACLEVWFPERLDIADLCAAISNGQHLSTWRPSLPGLVYI